MAAVGLSALWGNMMEDRRAKLQDIVTLAHEALDYNYQTSRQTGLSEADTMERAKTLLRNMRFGKGDYVYAIDTPRCCGVEPKSQGRRQEPAGRGRPRRFPLCTASA